MERTHATQHSPVQRKLDRTGGQAFSKLDKTETHTHTDTSTHTYNSNLGTAHT